MFKMKRNLPMNNKKHSNKFSFVRWFNEVDKEDTAIVGGKGANLGEMTQSGFPVPPGFIVTALAYKTFIAANKLQERIHTILSGVDVNDPVSLKETSDKVKKLILDGKIPDVITTEILKCYNDLSGLAGDPALVAVRSSATAEDLPGASFAGQQATFLNVFGDHEVVKKVQECWASLFEPRAIFYREQKNFDHFKVAIAVPVQKMIQSEISGVMFTINPTTDNKKTIIIEAIWGLGEWIVQGLVTPDHYEVEKSSLEITRKEIVKQEMQLSMSGIRDKEVAVPKNKQEKQKLTNREIQELAKLGKRLQEHYFFPQDAEWALEKGKIYLVQTRPITTIAEVQKKEDEEVKREKINLPLLLSGSPASPGQASGPVKIVHSSREISRVLSGDILVTEMTSPDFVPAMKKAAAIVTNKGGATSHAAIVSRELGIPCVVGTETATKVLKDNQVVTVNGATGEIFRGKSLSKPVSLSIASSSRSLLPHTVSTATKVYVNLAEPERAAEVAKFQVDGVGLLRAEFMIAEIGVHPKKAIHDGKKHEFIKKLADGMKIFCEAFFPRPVIYRATDFKTNEYRNLTGGSAYEPIEPNPMLGFRGAARYVADPEVFELELEAIKHIRNKDNLKNIWLMIPFVRTPKELLEVKKIVAAAGLIRSSTFHLLMMAEIPTNVIRLEDFLEIGIDGVSIGSNDLTMMLLGTDRDNEEVAPDFNEQDPAVLWAIEKLITTCKKQKVSCSICGQAPSRYPELVEKLVDWGITSVSVNPDVVDTTRQMIAQAEARLIKKK
jgi:pyruvate,water dikinase